MPRIGMQALRLHLVVIVLSAAASGATVVGIRGPEGWPGSGPKSTSSAKVLDLRPQTDRQLEILQVRVRQEPSDAETTALLGQMYLQKARESGDPTYYTRAATALQRALELDPRSVSALMGLGALAMAQHQFEDALAWAEQARTLAPQTAMVHGLVGDALIELGRYEDAVASFQKMVDTRPDVNSYSRVSYARELHGDVPGAVEAMRMAVQAGPPGQESTAWTRVQLGHLYFNSGDLDAAKAEYQRALVDVRGYLHALAGLGRVEAARGNHPAAIDFYRKATANVPLPEYVVALGEVYQAAGQPEQAAQQYELLGAMQQLFSANGVNTDLEIALFSLDHDRDVAQTLERVRAMVARRPTVKAEDTLAWALYKNGQCDNAQQAMGRAMRLGTQDALLFFHAGMIARCLGQHEQARAHLERALEINPYFSVLYAGQARETLAQLGGGALAEVKP